MGSISSFMSMVPGMGSNMIDKNSEKDNVKKIQKYLIFIHILDQFAF